MIVKTHNTERGLLIAIVDEGIVGKKFEEGRLQLDLNSEFYNGSSMDERKLLKLIKKAYVLNIVGKESIGFAIKNGLIDEGRIIKIAGIPHAQCLILRADEEYAIDDELKKG